MNDFQDTDTIVNIVWRACDALRGRNNPIRFRDPVLALFFLKYISDFHKFRQTFYHRKYKDDPIRIERALGRERFIIPKIEIRNIENNTAEEVPAHFDSLFHRRSLANLGELINICIAHLEDANKHKLSGIFRHIDFNRDADLGRHFQRNARLKSLLENLNRLDLQPEAEHRQKVIADAFDRLIARFAVFAGKKAGGFHTPTGVCEALVRLIAPKAGEYICDPFCGAGTLLIKACAFLNGDATLLFGQEIDGPTWSLCKMNFLLHGLDAARIEWDDSLRHPQFLDSQGALKSFDLVISAPPFGSGDWGQHIAGTDVFNRFYRGIPPKSKGDWAYISHMLAIAKEGGGRVAVVVPHGVLFRAGQEGKIREAIIREKILSGVIGLPANLFHGTDIPAVLMIFDKARPIEGKNDVFFIDASQEYEQRSNHRFLRPQDINKIVSTFHQRRAVEAYARPVTFRQIEKNDFDLNIPRYIDPFKHKAATDIQTVQQEINSITSELAQTQGQIQTYLKSLGFGSLVRLENSTIPPVSNPAFDGRLAAEKEHDEQTSILPKRNRMKLKQPNGKEPSKP